MWDERVCESRAPGTWRRREGSAPPTPNFYRRSRPPHQALVVSRRYCPVHPICSGGLCES
jgi:hypothetical protein